MESFALIFLNINRKVIGDGYPYTLKQEPHAVQCYDLYDETAMKLRMMVTSAKI